MQGCVFVGGEGHICDPIGRNMAGWLTEARHDRATILTLFCLESRQCFAGAPNKYKT